jgi:hypothetical protein
MRVLTEIKNRGVADVCMLVCDGLKGLPEVVGQVWWMVRAGQRLTGAEHLVTLTRSGSSGDEGRIVDVRQDVIVVCGVLTLQPGRLRGTAAGTSRRLDAPHDEPDVVVHGEWEAAGANSVVVLVHGGFGSRAGESRVHLGNAPPEPSCYMITANCESV